MPKLRTWIEILILSVLAAVFAWRGFVPAWRSLNTDFPNYYVAARLYSQGDSLARIYDWIWFQRQKDHAGVERRIVSFMPHPLYAAMPMVPLASMPPLQAKHYWLVINLILLAFSGFLLLRTTRIGKMRIAILMLLAVEPLRTHFLYGQLHVAVLALIVAALWLYLNEWKIASGAAIALAAAIKIYPLAFLFYFLRKRQWRAVTGLVCGCLLLAGLSILLFGFEVNRVLVEQVLPRIARGEGVDPYTLNLNSLTGLFHRLFVFEPQLNPKPLINMPSAYAVLQPLVEGLLFVPLLWLLTPAHAETEKETIEYATYVAAVLALSTNPRPYHYVILIACSVLVTDRLLRVKRRGQAMLFLGLYTLACLPVHRADGSEGFVGAVMSSSRLIFTLALYLFLLAVLSSASRETWKQRLSSRAAFVFVAIFLTGLSASVFYNLRYAKTDFRYEGRITSEAASLMMTDPSVATDRIAFTALQNPRYAVGTLAGKQASSLTATADLFYPTLIPGSSQAMAELAGTTSRIVRIDLDQHSATDVAFAVEVEDAERPAVSPDGRWLAFIREVHGRGSLWIKSIQRDDAEEGASDEFRLAGPEYDVLEAAFDSRGSEIIFAGQLHGGPALFTIQRESSTITQSTSGPASRFPAVSPDGVWLAYCRLLNGSWQIWLKSRHSADDRQLTAGSCNATSPAWTPDSKEIIYATDCGRGWGINALARLRAVP